jgi:hypothetical protein
MVARLFTEHPKSVGETYWQHLGTALGVWARLCLASVTVFIHAFLPFLFPTTGSRILKRLLAERDAPHRGKRT